MIGSYVINMIYHILNFFIIIFILLSFGILIYSHIELMKTIKEIDKVIDDDNASV